MKVEFPIIILNFKTYSESIGKKGLELAKIANNVAKDTDTNIVVCPQTIDLRSVVENVDIPVFAQHIDAINPGSHTGHNLMDAYLDSGISGTLINHSENQLKLSEIEKLIHLAATKEFFTIICANNVNVSKASAALNPSAVAMEPPELIGGDVSVTTKPNLVKNTIKSIKSINENVIPLVGAGVKTAQDIKQALKLGAKGVLLASGFVKSNNPEKELLEMANALK